MMRFSTLTGVALILVAAFLLFGGSFISHREVLDVGGMVVTAEEHHSVQPWIAGLALLAGVGLIVTGVRRHA